MVLVNLANSLSLRLVEIQHTFNPTRKMRIVFQLYPTVGAVFQDTLDLMHVWDLEWSEEVATQAIIVQETIGKSEQDIQAALIGQWTLFTQDQPVDEQLYHLFEYIEGVGIV